MDFPRNLTAGNDAGIAFMNTEVSLAHTFLDVAETTHRSEQRVQSHHDAQKAYEALVQFLPRLQLSAGQQQAFDREITKLRERMMQAGIEL